MQHLTEKEREKKNKVSEGCEEGETGKSYQQSLPFAGAAQLQSFEVRLPRTEHGKQPS